MNLERDAPFLDFLRMLRCAAAVARYGGAMHAAEAIYLSQPVITRAVKDLEKALGVSLFDRGARGMSATTPGQLVFRRVEALLSQLEQGAKEARVLGEPNKKILNSARYFAARVSPTSLHAITAVAVCGSEMRAAEHLNVTQPAVHRRLEELQRLAGVCLFHKSSRGTRLTPAGEALLRRVKLSFAELRALRSDLAAWRGEVRGELVIGTLPLSISLFLPRAVDNILLAHPELDIRVIDGTYEVLVEQLLRADIDILLGALRFPPPDGVQQKVLLEDSLAVVAHSGHEIFGLPNPVLADLLKYQWVLPLANSPAETVLHQVFADAGLPPPVGRLRAGSSALTRSLTVQTGRLALASQGEAQLGETALLSIVQVPLPQTVRRIGMAWRAEGDPAADLSRLLDELTKTYGGVASAKMNDLK